MSLRFKRISDMSINEWYKPSPNGSFIIGFSHIIGFTPHYWFHPNIGFTLIIGFIIGFSHIEKLLCTSSDNVAFSPVV